MAFSSTKILLANHSLVGYYIEICSDLQVCWLCVFSTSVVTFLLYSTQFWSTSVKCTTYCWSTVSFFLTFLLYNVHPLLHAQGCPVALFSQYISQFALGPSQSWWLAITPSALFLVHVIPCNVWHSQTFLCDFPCTLWQCFCWACLHSWLCPAMLKSIDSLPP